MNIRYERDEEFFATALRRVGGGLRDVQRATGTERAHTMETAETALVDSQFAKDLAEQLEVELGEANIELGQALADSAAALVEAGLARGEAATAVADAQAAVAEAEQAILDAAAAAGAASVADGKAVAAQAVAQSAQDDADNAVLAANAAASVAAAAGSDATDALADAETARLAAVAAQAKADQAFIDAAAAATAAGNAQTSANGKNRVWYQGTAPAGTGHKAGDTWFDTSNGNRVTQWDGDSWEVTQFGTGAIATAAITNALIADATIQSAKIANLDAAKITTGTLDAARIAALSISTGHLAADAVTAEKIAALTITAAEIASSAVTAVKIAANAVTAEKINAGAVTTAKLDALAVTAEKIAAGSIVAEKIAAEAITTAKLAATAIDGMTITGSTMRTAPSGQRMQFDINGLRAFNAADAVTAAIYASFGGFRISGNMIVSESDGSVPRAAITRESMQVLNGADVSGYPALRGIVEPGILRASHWKEKLGAPGTWGESTSEHQARDTDAFSRVFYRPPSAAGTAASSEANLQAMSDRARLTLRDQSMVSSAVIEARGGKLYVGDSDAPVDLVSGEGIYADGKLFAGDALRGNAAKMNALHSNGLAYDGLKFWRTDQLCFYIYIGGLWIKESTPETDTGWVPLTNFGTGWSSVAQDGYPALSARRRNGVVELRGVVQKSTWAAFETIVTLPTNLRPIHNTDGVCRYGYAAAVAASQVFSNGQVRITVAGSALVILAGTWMLG